MSVLSKLADSLADSGDDIAMLSKASSNLDDVAARKAAQFELLQKTNPMLDNYHTGIRSAKEINRLQDLVDKFDADNMFTNPDFTIDNARAAVAKGTLPVFSSKPIEPGVFVSPSKMMATDYAGGDASKVFSKEIPLEDFAAILSGDEGNYLPIARAKNDSGKADDMITLYRGIAAPDESTLQRYIDDMSNPNIVPKTYSGGSAYGQGYYFTPAKDLAESYAFGRADMPAGAIMEIQVPKSRFTQISKELGNRPADFDFAAMQRGVPEDIRFETGLYDFQKYMDDNGFWGSVGAGENPNYLVMRNDALSTLKRLLRSDDTI